MGLRGILLGLLLGLVLPLLVALVAYILYRRRHRRVRNLVRALTSRLRSATADDDNEHPGYPKALESKQARRFRKAGIRIAESNAILKPGEHHVAEEGASFFVQVHPCDPREESVDFSALETLTVSTAATSLRSPPLLSRESRPLSDFCLDDAAAAGGGLPGRERSGGGGGGFLTPRHFRSPTAARRGSGTRPKRAADEEGDDGDLDNGGAAAADDDDVTLTSPLGARITIGTTLSMQDLQHHVEELEERERRQEWLRQIQVQIPPALLAAAPAQQQQHAPPQPPQQPQQQQLLPAVVLRSPTARPREARRVRRQRQVRVVRRKRHVQKGGYVVLRGLDDEEATSRWRPVKGTRVFLEKLTSAEVYGEGHYLTAPQ